MILKCLVRQTSRLAPLPSAQQPLLESRHLVRQQSSSPIAASSTRDAPFTTLSPGPHFLRCRARSLRSPASPSTAAGSPPCSPAGTPASGSNADGIGCARRDDKPRYTLHICGSRRGTFPALFTPALRPDKPRPPHHPKNGLDPVRFKSAKLSQTQKDKTPGCKSRGSCFCNSPSRVNFSPSLGLLTLARR